MSTVLKKPDRESLSPAARVGEIILLGMCLLLLAFLVYHQAANTGFYTEKFGTFEMLCLYVPLLLAFSAPAVRALTGHRNPGRPFEAVTSLLLAGAAAWLLVVFPFNYAHLADALPQGVRFILAWVTDDIARIVFILQIVVGPLSALVNLWRYTVVRGEQVAIAARRGA